MKFRVNYPLFNSKDVHDKAVQTLKSLQNYLGVEFPLKKLDIVALPGFSAVKPVDNWGLIVFKYVKFCK